jgi:hypothetical protein
MGGKNVLWKNQLRETGKARLVDVTSDIDTSSEDVAYPYRTISTVFVDDDGDLEIAMLNKGARLKLKIQSKINRSHSH